MFFKIYQGHHDNFFQELEYLVNIQAKILDLDSFQGPLSIQEALVYYIVSIEA
jgi:hypothetical protein